VAVKAKDRHVMELTRPSDREFVLTRVFDAPRALVFEAWTRPEHVKQWYGCGAFALQACEIELRVGGTYRYTMRSPDGVDHTMTGVYHEISPPERLVYSERYITHGFESNEAVVTVTFVEQNGRTTLTSTVRHQSAADRDGHLNSGVEKGAAEVFDRLAAHLATMI
jgi:uncharacterized protein YndB with AHSA1/START domain